MGLTILKLTLVGLIPVFVSTCVSWCDKRTKLKNLKYWYRQAIIGLIFGGLSIVGSELGVKTLNNAVINVRDVAPVCAGLLFGGPAGIIAGAIGGLERFLAVYWGAGRLSRIACSISTLFAGIYAAIIRKYIFDNKHGRWYYGFISGLFIESFHMLMVFVTNMNDIETAYNLVHSCAIPMIISNSLCITIALISAEIISHEPLLDKERPRKISYYVQIGLTFAILAGYLLISSLTYFILDGLSTRSTTDILKINIQDVENEINDEANSKIINAAKNVRNAIEIYYQNGITEDEWCDVLTNKILNEIGESDTNLLVSEINIVSKEGIIEYSTNASNIGFDMSGYDQSFVFNCLLDEKSEYVQSYQPTIKDSNIKMKYAGVKFNIKNDSSFGYLQVGYDSSLFFKIIDEYVISATANRHVGKNGSVLIANENGIVLSGIGTFLDDNLRIELMDLDVLSSHQVTSTDYYYYATCVEGYYIIGVYQKSEADLNRNISMYVTILTEVIIFTLLYFLIYVSLKKLVVNKISSTNETLELICSGKLDTKASENFTYEFDKLSNDINKTVDTLKDYIKQAEKRNEVDMILAQTIQLSSLPSTFPPFPSYHEFDIFASMNTAKEVGGDFYDFYLVDSRHLAVLIADVSGKGIPAAMFMMQAKSILKSLIETGVELSSAVTIANDKLCESNDAQMFVTCFIGILNLDSGLFEFVNAGHNPPLIGRKETGKFEYLKTKPGLVLAGMEGIKYRMQTVTLNPGDILYLYTDGVSEATNNSLELYGENRLLNIANNSFGLNAKSFIESVTKDVGLFVNGAEQSDDITMLTLIYYGKRNIKEIEVDAISENITQVTKTIETFLLENECTTKIINQVNVVIDEIFSNIALYAYKDIEVGKVNITVEIIDDIIIITFTDNGAKFNPLEKEDPDVKLTLENRKIGGLGIFMVKKIMDSVSYDNINGKNVLTLKKKISEDD